MKIEFDKEDIQEIGKIFTDMMTLYVQDNREDRQARKDERKMELEERATIRREEREERASAKKKE